MLEASKSPLGINRGYAEMSVREAAGRRTGFQVVDVRDPDEFMGPLGRITEAVNIPLGELEQRSSELDEQQPVLAVCRSGRRSALACEVLERKGFGQLYNLTGGMLAWTAAGLPTEGEAPC